MDHVNGKLNWSQEEVGGYRSCSALVFSLSFSLSCLVGTDLAGY